MCVHVFVRECRSRNEDSARSTTSVTCWTTVSARSRSATARFRQELRASPIRVGTTIMSSLPRNLFCGRYPLQNVFSPLGRTPVSACRLLGKSWLAREWVLQMALQIIPCLIPISRATTASLLHKYHTGIASQLGPISPLLPCWTRR